MITQKELKGQLQYDPITGVFTRISNKKEVGCKNNSHGYISIGINKKRHLAHRLAWLYVHGDFPKNEIDHINRDKQDNRIDNLRDATRSENIKNRVMKFDLNKMRKVNKLEAFRPSEKSKIIVDALQGKFTKTHIYNTLIERFGKQLAFESLSESDYYNLIQELEELK